MNAVMPVMGGLSDKVGKKIFIASGLALLQWFPSFISQPVRYIHLQQYDYWMVWLCRDDWIVPIAMAYAGEVAQEGKEGRAMGTFVMMYYSGLAVWPILGGFLWHLFGMPSVFYVLSGISVIALLLVLPFLLEVNKPKASKTEEHESFKSIIKHGAVEIILLIGFIASFRMGVLLSFLPPHASSFNINGRSGGNYRCRWCNICWYLTSSLWYCGR